MGLWDVLTGKVQRWNQKEDEATCHVYRQLKPFVSSRLKDYPQYESAFVNVRNALMAFYVGSATFIANELDGKLRDFKERLLGLNSHLYLYFICTFHAAHVVSVYWNEETDGILTLMSEGICDMYCRPYSYMLEWHKCKDWLKPGADPRPAGKLASRMHDELAPLLGLRPNDIFQSAYWLFIAADIARVMQALYDNPKWPTIVEQELARV